MNTISKCFLYIAILCALTLANFHFFFDGLVNGNYWLTILCFFATATGIWGINGAYNRAKLIEQSMGVRVYLVITENESKGKDNEVETDK